MPTISPKAAARLPEMLNDLREMNRKLDAALDPLEALAKPQPRKRARKAVQQ